MIFGQRPPKIAFLFSSGAIKERLESFADFEDRTLQIRLQLWNGGWQIFKDHPIIGCGFKCVDTIFPKYPEHAKVLQRYKGMHNNLIQMSVDTGIVGLVSWTSIWVGYFFVLFRRWKEIIELGKRWVGLGGHWVEKRQVISCVLRKARQEMGSLLR